MDMFWSVLQYDLSYHEHIIDEVYIDGQSHLCYDRYIYLLKRLSSHWLEAFTTASTSSLMDMIFTVNKLCNLWSIYD